MGSIGLVPLDDQGRPIPPPVDADGHKLNFPRSLKAASWQGLVRVADFDGTLKRVRLTRKSKGAAEMATRQAALALLKEMAVQREGDVQRKADKDAGDALSTVADLVSQVLHSPAFEKKAPRTQQNYRYAAAQICGQEIAVLLPRDLDVVAVRSFLMQMASEHGKGGAERCRAVLRMAMDIGTESRAMHVPFNPVLLAKQAIPNAAVRPTGIDHKRAPTDDEVTNFLASLRADPEAGPMIGPRTKSPHGKSGTAAVNGTDIADLITFTFGTGTRIGEASALRWSDLRLLDVHPTANITGTVAWIKGLGTVRQERTKSTAGTRNVPLSSNLVQILKVRADLFGIDLAEPSLAPVFPSRQHHDRFRDPNNLSRTIKKMFTKHGLDYARSHVARKWRVTSLVERGVPIGKVADVVGHAKISTTLGYVGRGRGTDPDVRRALE